MKHEDLICGDRVYINGSPDLFTVTAKIYSDTHSSVTVRQRGAGARSLNPHDTIAPGQMLPRVELDGDRVQDLRPGDVFGLDGERHKVAMVRIGRMFTEVSTSAGRVLRLVTGLEVEIDRSPCIVTTAQIEAAWNPRGEWGALGPVPIADDEEWVIARRAEGYVFSRRGRDGRTYVALQDFVSADDVRAIGGAAARYVDLVEGK